MASIPPKALSPVSAKDIMMGMHDISDAIVRLSALANEDEANKDERTYIAYLLRTLADNIDGRKSADV